MTLDHLTDALLARPDRPFQLRLPSGSAVPVAFHVTEVAHVRKALLDCGGTRREAEWCQLQVWLGPDGDHALVAGKMAAILTKARRELGLAGSLPLEFEYEDGTISQYTVAAWRDESPGLVIDLAAKHPACLAPELCLPPAPVTAPRPRISLLPS